MADIIDLHANYDPGDVWIDATDTDKDRPREWGGEVDKWTRALFDFGGPLIGGYVTASVAANALTIAVKTSAGDDPSSGSPVIAIFRDVDAGDGNPAAIVITAALSLTVPATATLGAVDGQPFALEATVFNDGGTARLGIVRPSAIVSGALVSLPLGNASLASATAIDSSADSAGVIYASQAIGTPNKAMFVAARLIWSAGLAAAGVYDVAPTTIEARRPGVRLTPSEGGIFKMLTADDTGGQNVDTAQPWFPTAGAVTVQGYTTYRFDGTLWLSRSAGTTSHTTAVLFGGTATVEQIGYLGGAKTGDANTLAGISWFFKDAVTAHVVKAASTSATEQVIARVTGLVRFAAGGTFIPQFQYSAAPGGAPTAKAGSYFAMRPIVSPPAAVAAGAWA